MTESPTVTSPLPEVLTQLAELLAQISPERYDAPTPCPDFDVRALRAHILGWLEYFAGAFEHPDEEGERPDPATVTTPADPAQAAGQVRATADRISACLAAGAADRPVMMFGDTMPAIVPLNMCLMEYLVHGHDLARATGLPWNPSAATAAAVLEFAPGMLTDDFRGPDKSFGYPVEVPDSASTVERLVAFTGRDPFWQPPA